MKLRSTHIIAAVITTIGLFVLLAAWRQATSKPASDEEFFDELHRIQEDIPVTDGTGSLLPEGVDGLRAPSIELEPDFLDLGVVSNSELTLTEISVHNRGGMPLEIAGVDTECACTRGAMRNEVVPPGQTGTLDIVFDPFRVFGFSSQKTVTIMSNDVHNTPLALEVKAEIEPEFSIDPSVLDFGNVEKGNPAKIDLLLRQLTGDPFSVKELTLEGDNPMVQFNVVKRPEEDWLDAARAEYAVEAVLSETLIPGPHRQLAKLHVECNRIPYVSLPITATVNAPYRVHPKQIRMRHSDANAVEVITVEADQPFTLETVRTQGTGLSVITKAAPSPNMFLIEVRAQPVSRPKEEDTAVLFSVKGNGFSVPNRVPVRILGTQQEQAHAH